MVLNVPVSWQHNLADQELNILNKCSLFSRTVLVSISILSNGNSSDYSIIGKVMKRRNNPSGIHPGKRPGSDLHRLFSRKKIGIFMTDNKLEHHSL